MYAQEVGFIPLAKETIRSVCEQLDDAANKLARSTLFPFLFTFLPNQLTIVSTGK